MRPVNRYLALERRNKELSIVEKRPPAAAKPGLPGVPLEQAADAVSGGVVEAVGDDSQGLGRQ